MIPTGREVQRRTSRGSFATVAPRPNDPRSPNSKWHISDSARGVPALILFMGSCFFQAARAALGCLCPGEACGVARFTLPPRRSRSGGRCRAGVSGTPSHAAPPVGGARVQMSELGATTEAPSPSPSASSATTQTEVLATRGREALNAEDSQQTGAVLTGSPAPGEVPGCTACWGVRNLSGCRESSPLTFSLCLGSCVLG